MENFLKVATPEEIAEFIGEPWEIEILKDIVQPGGDSENAWLARLYHARGDKKMSDKYLNAIKDGQYKMDTTLIMYEVVRP